MCLTEYNKLAEEVQLEEWKTNSPGFRMGFKFNNINKGEKMQIILCGKEIR